MRYMYGIHNLRGSHNSKHDYYLPRGRKAHVVCIRVITSLFPLERMSQDVVRIISKTTRCLTVSSSPT